MYTFAIDHACVKGQVVPILNPTTNVIDESEVVCR